MPWKITPYRPSVPMPYKWSTAISHLQVTRGLQKTVWRHRWTAVLIRPCSTLHKEGAWRKLFQVKYCENIKQRLILLFFELSLIMIITINVIFIRLSGYWHGYLCCFYCYSDGGIYTCIYSKTVDSQLYFAAWNNDDTLTSSTYRFSCFVSHFRVGLT